MAPRRRVSKGKKASSPPPAPEAEGPEDDKMQVDEAVADAGAGNGADDNDDDEDDDDSDSSDGEPIVPLLATRERRANAGNRMAALLEDEAQAEVEDMFKEEENDIEFEAKFEEDVFDSDFGSTDSDADQEDDEEAGERQLQREAKAAAKGNKKKATKAYTPFAPAFARQTKYQQKASAVASTSASTLDGDGTSTPGEGAWTPELSNRNKRRRGWPDGIDPAFLIPQRESSRRSAVAFKESVEGRLKESEERRATLPKPSKKTQQNLTQADLIAEALETEEINRASLLAFYAAEEDRRAAERVIGQRYEIIGPKLIELSRREGGLEAPNSPGKRKGKGRAIDGGATAVRSGESGRRRLIEVLGETGKAGWKPEEEEELKAAQEAAEKKGTTMDKTRQILSPGNGGKHADVGGTDADAPVPDDNLEPEPSSGAKIEALDPPTVPIAAETNGGVSTLSAVQDAPTTITQNLNPKASVPFHTRNYLIFDEFVGATAGDEMEALFGDHCDWDTAKSVTLEPNRRPKFCPITGLSAKYRDPRTMTPFANKYAYDVLTQLLSSTKTNDAAGKSKPVFSWNETLGAYTGIIGLGRLHVDVGTNPGSPAPSVGTIEKDPITVHEQSIIRAPKATTSAGPTKAPRLSTGYMGVGGRNAKKRDDNE